MKLLYSLLFLVVLSAQGAFGQCTIDNTPFTLPTGGFLPAQVVYNVGSPALNQSMTRVFASRVDTAYPLGTSLPPLPDTITLKIRVTNITLNAVNGLPNGATLDLASCNRANCSYDLDTTVAASLGTANRGCLTLTGIPTVLGTSIVEVVGRATGTFISIDTLRSPLDFPFGTDTLRAGDVLIPANTPVTFEGQCNGCSPLLPQLLPIILPPNLDPQQVAGVATFRLRVINTQSRLEDQLATSDFAIAPVGSPNRDGNATIALYAADQAADMNWRLMALDGRIVASGETKLAPNTETFVNMAAGLTPGIYLAYVTTPGWKGHTKLVVQN